MRVIKHWAFIISAEMVTALAYASVHLCNLSAHLTHRLMDMKPTLRPTPKTKVSNEQGDKVSNYTTWASRLMNGVYACAVGLAVKRTASLMAHFVEPVEAWVSAVTIEGLAFALVFALLSKTHTGQQRRVALAGIVGSLALSLTAQLIEAQLAAAERPAVALHPLIDFALRGLVPVAPTLADDGNAAQPATQHVTDVRVAVAVIHNERVTPDVTNEHAPVTVIKPVTNDVTSVTQSITRDAIAVTPVTSAPLRLAEPKPLSNAERQAAYRAKKRAEQAHMTPNSQNDANTLQNAAHAVLEGVAA